METLRNWWSLCVGLAEGVIPAYIFFALMGATARRWKKRGRPNGILVLRTAQVLLLLATVSFLVDFVHSVRHPLYFPGDFVVMGLWILGAVVIFPVFCISVVTHIVMGQKKD
ncbi:MAG: hypothetical protein JXB13_02595 [Phycisphaerae bacterium]|nr:hypothetical protein [Phycisphaerae bacterium]